MATTNWRPCAAGQPFLKQCTAAIVWPESGDAGTDSLGMHA